MSSHVVFGALSLPERTLILVYFSTVFPAPSFHSLPSTSSRYLMNFPCKFKIPRIYPKCYVMVNFYDEIYFLGIKLRSRSVPLSYCITETIMDLYSLLQTNEISEIFKALPKLFIKRKFQNSKCHSLLTCFVIFFLKHKQLGTHCYSSSIFFIKVSRHDSN